VLPGESPPNPLPRLPHRVEEGRLFPGGTLTVGPARSRRGRRRHSSERCRSPAMLIYRCRGRMVGTATMMSMMIAIHSNILLIEKLPPLLVELLTIAVLPLQGTQIRILLRGVAGGGCCCAAIVELRLLLLQLRVWMPGVIAIVVVAVQVVVVAAVVGRSIYRSGAPSRYRGRNIVLAVGIVTCFPVIIIITRTIAASALAAVIWKER
jgi:hypothetical protein